MKKGTIKTITLCSALCLMALPVAAEEDFKDQAFNPISTGVTTLGITPDARAGGMGDLGVATDPDVNSQFWNPAKYAFAYSPAGVSLSYTPWLRKLVNDMNLAYLAGYKKLGYEQNQAISASLTYFSLGEINMYEGNGALVNTISPYEMAVDLGYSRKLSEAFSMGVVFRYIHSDLGFGDESGKTGGSAFAADVAAFHTSYPIVGRNECQWSWGMNVSNVGSKISYGNEMESAFLPTNLRLGTTFTFPLADYNNLALSVDFNKLLVPAKPQLANYESEEAYHEAETNYYNMSPIAGIFNSFTDAPGGMKEELREVNYSIGAEYNYNYQFFLRAGYFNENQYKGNRKYFTLGTGFSLNVFRLDAAYVISTAQTSPLDQTLRFTLAFDMEGINQLMGR